MPRDDDNPESPSAIDRAASALESATTSIAAANHALAQRTQRVVVVIEDDEDNRDLHARSLSMQGFRVATAMDGNDGLKTAREIQPDVIVLDLGLPVVDGWEVTRLLRADAAMKGVFILACSGYAANDDQERALAAGVDAFLVKPCDPDVLCSVLLKLFD